MKHILMYTDGSCLGNPGPGGWCCIVRFGNHEKILRGGELNSTNNRMEIQAVLKGLQNLKEPCKVTLYSDSKYVLQAIDTWIHNWAKNDWRGASKKPIKNPDLFKDLYLEVLRHTIKTEWVKGHSGHPENELCDQYAREEAELISI